MVQSSNPDHALVLALVQGAAAPLAVDCNPVALDLATSLEAWVPASQMLQLGFRAEPRHLQGNGAVHGGVVTTMLDFGLAFVVLARLQPPRVAVTVALNVHFERAVMPGALQVHARIDRLGGRMAFASAELSATGSRDVLARATATLAIVG